MKNGRTLAVVSFLAVVLLIAGCGGSNNSTGSSSSSNSQSLTGHWSGTAIYAGIPVPLEIGLVQTGNSLSSDGTLDVTSNGITLTVTATGTVSGNNIEITYVEKMNGQTFLTYMMEGTVSNNTMSGDLLVVVTGGGTLAGTFELTKQ